MLTDIKSVSLVEPVGGELVELSEILEQLWQMIEFSAEPDVQDFMTEHQCNLMAETVDKELRKKIYWHVTKFLGGQWRDVSCCELKVKPLSGGLSNYLYICSLPSNKQPSNGEPESVLVRIFGDLLKDDALIMDSVIFALLAEKGVGPRLHGVFPGGRIEEFIPSRCLTSEEFRVPDISKQIAQHMGRFHSLCMPVSKDPEHVFNMMERYLDDVRDGLETSGNDRVQSFYSQNDLHNQLSWLREILKKINSPIVFCHNDVQAGNILTFTRRDGCMEMKMIDFEYSGYGYRGLDIANHFCEWSLDNFYPEPPYYKEMPDKVPSLEEKLWFFKWYRSVEPPHSAVGDDQLLQEVEWFSLLSHLMWAFWSLAQSFTSTIPFDYVSYAECRMRLFLAQKAKLQDSPIVEFLDDP